MIAKRKSASLIHKASRPVIEVMEQRQLLSAALNISSSLFVFNAVKNSSASPTQTLTLTDTGDAALTLGSGAFSLANDATSSTQDASLFNILNAASAPASLAPGASFNLQLSYSANAIATNKAILDIASSDPINPVKAVSLHGIGTGGLGGTNQPSLATILQAYNIPTLVGEGPNDANAAIDSTYPSTNNIDPSTQEVVMQRFQKAGGGPITIDVLASFTAGGFSRSYTLGTYSPGAPTALNELFYTPGSQYQTTYVQPQGTTSFDPGSSAFGFYFISNVQAQGRVGYSEDSLNTWDSNNSSTGSSTRKMRFFPMENADGSVVPNTYILTSTEWNAPSGYDFTNMVAVVSNITFAPSSPGAPVMGLQDANALPGSSNMVFNRINGNSTVGDVVHDIGTLEINNTGSSPLVVTSATLNSSQWVLSNPPTFPVSIAAGSSLALQIQFVATTLPSISYNETNDTPYPTGGGVWTGMVTIASNDPNNPTQSMTLKGWWQQNSENNNEPSLQSMINLMEGWGTNINPTPAAGLTESLSTSGSKPTYYGEEVVSPYWQQADSSAPITVTQLGSYHTEGTTATSYWYTQGASGTLHKLYVTAPDDGQTLFPLEQSSTSLAIASFNTTTTFGFKTDSLFTDDSLNTGSNGAGGGHHFRFYPLRTAGGALVPNTYMLGLDYATTDANFDFQDVVYIITNIHPATVVSGIGSTQSTQAPPAPNGLSAISSNGTNTITWEPVIYGNLAGYNLFRSTSLNGSYTQINTSFITGFTYTDTGAARTGTSYYKVQAIDSSTGNHSLGDIGSVVNTTGTSNPVAAAENVSTGAVTPVTINVVADATDNAFGTINASSVAITTQPVDGTLTVNASTGAITYTPIAGFSGIDTFQYTISDSAGVTSTPATVMVTVTNTPTGTPVAANLSFSVHENTALDFAVASAATDNVNATIVPTSVVITVLPTHGTAIVNATTGDIVYTPSKNYTGKDTLSYTIADNLGAVSSPATISLTVSSSAAASGPVGTNVTVPVSTSGSGSTLINVLAHVNDSSGTLNAASVVLTTLPTHGTYSVDPTTGAITYTPTVNFVGSDSLQYTVTDSLGLTSQPIKVSINDGVTINNSTAKSLAFTDASGAVVTITLAGGGSALLTFNGTGTATEKAGPHGTGTLAVAGTGLGINGIAISGSTIASVLTITRKGSGSTAVSGINSTGALGKIVASTSTLSGNINISGGITSIQAGNVANANFTIGSAGARPGGFTFTSASVTSTSLTSAMPIKSIKVTQWVDSATSGRITAPEILSLVTTKNFIAGITATGTSPFSLKTIHIGGQAGGTAWNISGNSSSIYYGSVTSTFSGTFTGAVNALTIKAGGFAGNISAGSIGTLSITGNDTGDITAGSIKTGKISGTMSNATITLTNGVAPKAYSLTHLQIVDAMISSSIISAGNINTITAGGMTGSTIDAGVVNGVTLPSTAGDFNASATISAFSITGRGSTFANSNVAAIALGNINLGTVTTANKGVGFGLAASTINNVAASLDIGGVLRMNKTVLANSGGVTTYLSEKSLSLGDFVIRPGL